MNEFQYEYYLIRRPKTLSPDNWRIGNNFVILEKSNNHRKIIISDEHVRMGGKRYPLYELIGFDREPYCHNRHFVFPWHINEISSSLWAEDLLHVIDEEFIAPEKPKPKNKSSSDDGEWIGWAAAGLVLLG